MRTGRCWRIVMMCCRCAGRGMRLASEDLGTSELTLVVRDSDYYRLCDGVPKG